MTPLLFERLLPGSGNFGFGAAGRDRWQPSGIELAACRLVADAEPAPLPPLVIERSRAL